MTLEEAEFLSQELVQVLILFQVVPPGSRVIKYKNTEPQQSEYVPGVQVYDVVKVELEVQLPRPTIALK